MGPYVNQKPYMMQQPIVPKEPAKSIPKPLGAKENKIFSRASYHVAIAYDIHLHKVYSALCRSEKTQLMQFLIRTFWIQPIRRDI